MLLTAEHTDLWWGRLTARLLPNELLTHVYLKEMYGIMYGRNTKTRCVFAFIRQRANCSQNHQKALISRRYTKPSEPR
jgi:hypothetical protein